MFVTADRTRLIVAPLEEPLTLDQVKLRAGQDWAAGDPRDALVAEYLAAARQRVERDTELALLTQTRDAFAKAPAGEVLDGVQLAGQCLPLQEVVSVSSVAPDGVLTDVGYSVDLARGRIVLDSGLSATADGGPQIAVRVIAGWLTPADLAKAAPLLVHAVGLLTTHYLTIGRDVINVGHIVAEVPYGYDDAVASYRAVGVI